MKHRGNIPLGLSIFLVAVSVGLWTGCEQAKEPDPWVRDHPLPSREQIVQNGHALLGDAQTAERRGDYARALDFYGKLQSYPDYAKPADLDMRIHNAKFKSGGGS